VIDGVASPLFRARHELGHRRPDRALGALATVTGDEMQTAEFWALSARALHQLERSNDAVEAASAGLAYAPGDVELLDLLALAQLACGDKRRARKTIEYALELHPEEPVLHAHRALILLLSVRRWLPFARYGKARAAVDEALRFDPYCDVALRVRAGVAALSRDRRAAEYSAELLSFDPEDERAHVIAGTAHASSGDTTQGLRHYVEAARLDPSDRTLVWLGKRSRILQSRFAAPALVFRRWFRGWRRLIWIWIVLAAVNTNLLLGGIAFVFVVYLWTVNAYVRVRAGKAPK
jgi:tetratricopeptide (TPR) repeat protein